MTQEIIEKPMSAKCTMKQYEAIPDSDFVENREYQLTDYPDNGANAEQMAYALTCNRLFPEGSSFICSDDGTYKKGVAYKIIINSDGTKGWEPLSASTEVEIDNTTITKNQENKLQASGLTNNTNTYTLDQLLDLFPTLTIF